MPATINALGVLGFILLLLGGISFSVGAFIYILSKKKNLKFGHSIFHIFVVIGVMLQFFGIFINL